MSQNNLRKPQKRRDAPTQECSTAPVRGVGSGSAVTTKSIASQICKWASQSMANGCEPLELGKEVAQDDYGPVRRLYSDITTRTAKGTYEATAIEHKFPISGIFMPLDSAATATSDTNMIYINAGEFKLTGNDGFEVTLQQQASFHIETGVIELFLKQKDGKLWYKSQYKVANLYEPNARIVLDPYTEDEANLISQVHKRKTIFTKLNKKVVNIYSYLNGIKAIGGDRVTFSSSFAELKTAFGKLTERYTFLKKNNYDANKLELSQFEFIEETLSSAATLDSYKKELVTWYENYKWWGRKAAADNTIENHTHILDFVKAGKPRLSTYQKKLIDRTEKYDERISIFEDTEQVIDYTKTDQAIREVRQSKHNVTFFSKKLNEARGINNAKEVAKLTHKLESAKAEAAKSLKSRMTNTQTIYQIDREHPFGIYTPYLVSDILRYFKLGFVQDVASILCITRDNIEDFSKRINGFKSLVFNIVSLHNQLVSHHKTERMCTSGSFASKPSIIIRVGYSSILYPNFKWFSEAKSDGEISTYTSTQDISQFLMFMPCETVTKSFKILATTPTDPFIELQLLNVDEPLYGDETKLIQDDKVKVLVLDFDSLYAEQYGSFKSGVTLSENFDKFAQFKYNLTEDEIDKSTIVEQAFDEMPEGFLDDMEEFPAIGTSSKKVHELSSTSVVASPAKLVKSPISSLIESVMSKSVKTNPEKVSVMQPQPPVVIQPSKEVAVTFPEPGYDVDSDSESNPVDEIFGSTDIQPEIEYFQISDITRTGKVKLADTHNHNFKTDDNITFRDLKGLTLQELQTERIDGKTPNEAFLANEQLIKELNNSNWKIIVDAGKTKNFKLFMINSVDKGKFNLVTNGEFSVVPYIKSGRVHQTIDYLGDSGKVVRDTSRDSRDKQQYSQSQKAEYKAKLHNKELALELGFENLEKFLAAKKDEENNSLFDKVFDKLENSAELLSIENLDDKILNLIIDIRSKNKDVFDGLEITELVLIIKYYLLNPDNTDNLRALYKNPIAIGLSKKASIDKLENEPRDNVSEKHGTTHGTMLYAVNRWIEERRNGNSSSSSSSSTSKQYNKGKANREKYLKYLKYKGKYLALKAKLGL